MGSNLVSWCSKNFRRLKPYPNPASHDRTRQRLWQPAYTHTAQLIPKGLPYQPALKLPAVYTARIESNGEYALLDENGRFKVRMLFDTRDPERGSPSYRSQPAGAKNELVMHDIKDVANSTNSKQIGVTLTPFFCCFFLTKSSNSKHLPNEMRPSGRIFTS